jgi:hypothetical protein
MHSRTIVRLFLIASVVALAVAVAPADEKAKAPEWSMNATAIEACSCPMFCQCYFNSAPAGHAEHQGHATHYCRFNMAYKVNRGNYGTTDLAGAKFWVAGDLGGDFSKGQMDWAVLTFDPSVTKAQREGITAALGKLFPVKWSSFKVADDAPIAWQANKDMAAARLDAGKTAEVILTRPQGNTDDPIVISNLKYWGAPRNDGFILMPNKTEAYRVGDKAFEYHGTNGFMITVDINSKDTM